MNQGDDLQAGSTGCAVVLCALLALLLLTFAAGVWVGRS